MDMLAVLLCPKTQASTMYYKAKLQIHNFILYNAFNKNGYCYIWNESEGDLSSEVFTHLQFQHFYNYLSEHNDIEELVILWSDGCNYQNRNSTLSNAYIALAKNGGL